MTGNEEFTYPYSTRMKCKLDTNGSPRNFNPSGVFPDMFEVVIVNIGAQILTFDSAVLAGIVSPGLLGFFYYDAGADAWIG